MLTASSIVLASCAGVGGKDDGNGSDQGGGAAAEPAGTLAIMGFSGKDEVAQARMTASKAAFPKVSAKNNKAASTPSSSSPRCPAAIHPMSFT